MKGIWNEWDKKETPPLQAPAIPVINLSDRTVYKAGKSVYDIFKNYGQEYDYDQEIKAAERNRKGALIADMATALSNIGTGLAGRRAYVNTPRLQLRQIKTWIGWER